MGLVEDVDDDGGGGIMGGTVCNGERIGARTPVPDGVKEDGSWALGSSFADVRCALRRRAAKSLKSVTRGVRSRRTTGLETRLVVDGVARANEGGLVVDALEETLGKEVPGAATVEWVACTVGQPNNAPVLFSGGLLRAWKANRLLGFAIDPCLYTSNSWEESSRAPSIETKCSFAVTSSNSSSSIES